MPLTRKALYARRLLSLTLWEACDKNIIAPPPSCKDTIFEAYLKRRSNTQRFKLAVYNIEYLKQCSLVEKAGMKGRPTFLYLTFKYTDEEKALQA